MASADVPVQEAERFDAARATLAAEGDVIIARLERLPFTRMHWKIAGLLATGTFFDSFDSLIIGSVLTVIVSSMHLSFQSAGVLVSAAFAGQLIGAIGAGILSEIAGRRTVLLGSITIFGLMALVCAFAQDLNQLYVARAIQGLGLGAEVPIAGALFNELVRGKSRGTTVGLYQSAFSWGIQLGPPAALLVYATFGNDPGWRVMFGLGALPLLLTFARSSILPESPRWQIQHGQVDKARRTLDRFESAALRAGQSLSEPIVRPLTLPKRTNFFELFGGSYRTRTIQVWIQWFCASYIGQSFNTLLGALLVAGGLEVSQALLVSTVSGLISLVWTYTFVRLFDRVGRKPLFAGGFALAAIALLVGAVVVGLFGMKQWYVLAGVTLLVNMGAAPSNLGLHIYTPELYPTRMRGWGNAAASSMNRLAQAVGPAVAGTLIAGAFGIAAVFALNGIIALIAVITVIWLGIETKGKILEEIAA